MADCKFTKEEWNLFQHIHDCDGAEIERDQWPVLDALAAKGVVHGSAARGPGRAWRRGTMTEAGTIEVAKPRCTYPHHKEYLEVITCRCGQPMSCGAFHHACAHCEPAQFRRCGLCRQPVVFCTC